jgi:tetratricopeptide (TPR) repeat protein
MKARILRIAAILWIFHSLVLAQDAKSQPSDAPPPAQFDLSGLELNPEQRTELEAALEQRDYQRAETILVGEVEHDPKSLRAANLLEFAGGVFFLDGKYLNSVIAWKKAEAIAPLDERTRFTLAMAYIKLGRRDWAQPVLEKLTSRAPANPLYTYWLARLDYDNQRYVEAIASLQKVVELDPKMTRAFDLLGLCYDYLGRVGDAITSFGRAVALNREDARPSPWPSLDMAIAQIEVNQLPEAEKYAREAIGYDSRLPQAHYQLGRILDKRGQYQEAIQALATAAALDAKYAEPHYLLGRIYQRLGQRALANKEIQQFRALEQSRTTAPGQSPAPDSQ